MPKRRKFIQGIHNYCDRWCERCPMTAHCSVFAIEQVQKEYEKTTTHDQKSQAFWDGLEAVLHSAIEEIVDDGRERGYEFELAFDPDDDSCEDKGVFKAEPIEWKPKRSRREKTKIPTLSASAHEYMLCARAFLEKHDKDFEDEDAIRHLLERRKAAGVHPQKDCALVANAIEVIRWYHTLLTVKLMRALGTHEREDEDDEEVDEEFTEFLEQCGRDDADGSAKVSLIGIDRSIQAWAVIHQKLPHLAGDALDSISRLTDLRDRIQSSLPNARRFKRPGFDEWEVPIHFFVSVSLYR